VVEVDGGQHAEQLAYDAARDHFIQSEGFIVLRFWSNEVLKQTDGVLQVIRRTIEEKKLPPSCPSPAGCGGRDVD
jgi:very-short-patch-repair endonuclease